jgi:hypothetical protein
MGTNLAQCTWAFMLWNWCPEGITMGSHDSSLQLRLPFKASESFCHAAIFCRLFVLSVGEVIDSAPLCPCHRTFGEFIDSASGPICVALPMWRPSVKSSIVPRPPCIHQWIHQELHPPSLHQRTSWSSWLSTPATFLQVHGSGDLTNWLQMD